MYNIAKQLGDMDSIANHISDLVYDDFSWLNWSRTWKDIRWTIRSEVSFELEHQIEVMFNQCEIENNIRRALTNER